VLIAALARLRRGGYPEFGSPRASAEPSLNTVIRMLENTGNPSSRRSAEPAWAAGWNWPWVVYYRVAVKGAQIALPEVKLGLMPGAGARSACPAHRRGSVRST